ncbi:MAG: N-6 DNA methylase [Nannocystis sp.]|nr:N-6 DNA methylase [Nannocystis sp.]
MSTVTRDIVQKLWNLCNVLRDAGITYQQYVSELSFLLFLKMAKETGQEQHLPAGLRWDPLRDQSEGEVLGFYRGLLQGLGTQGSAQVRAIFHGASTALKEPRHLRILLEGLDRLDWFEARREGLGDLYEGLLAKNAGELKSGAGQYFTPRPLVDSMVALLQPRPGEVIQDPAAGTGGFLVAAHRWLRTQPAGSDRHAEFDQRAESDELGADPRRPQRPSSEYGTQAKIVAMELVEDVQRLLRMNLLLHDIEGQVVLGDALSSAGAGLGRADLILTNPPFGSKKGGGGPSRVDLEHTSANKQLAFLQHVYRGLRPGGRAGVVVPDNVLFEDHTGRQVRAELMERCDLHTVLRLPTGIFYAQGVKTNVLFFTRGETDRGNTRAVWIYDLRSGMPNFGKRSPFTREQLADFEAAYGADPRGRSERREQARWRRFSREQIGQRGDNLDIAWQGESGAADHEQPGDPEVLTAGVLELLRAVAAELEALQADLGGDTGR